jgi:large subunit ribosomal protein L18
MSINHTSFKRRKNRVRTKLRKVSNRNRLSVFKSGRHIYAQIINDDTSKTLVSASTLEKSIYTPSKSNCNIECAIKVGKILAERAEKQSIKLVAFDKGGHKYHGVIKALANEARKKIQF